MRTRLIGLVVVVAGILTCGDLQPVWATKIDPLSWEQLVLQADFVGVVECEITGGSVAEYRVVETWKGSKVGERIRIKLPPNYWGQQYQVTLCDERYFVTVFKADAPSNLVSTTSGGPVPLWWRDIPADYQTPLLQGLGRLPTKKEDAAKPEPPRKEERAVKGGRLADDPLDDFAKFRKEMQALLALKPEEREAVMLRLEIMPWLHGALSEQPPEKSKTLKALVEKKAGAEELVAELIRLAPLTDPDLVQYHLANAGGAVTLAQVEKIPARSAPWHYHENLLEALRVRLGKADPQPAPPPDRPRKPEPAVTEALLKECRAALSGGPKAQGFQRAFTTLAQHDPAPVVEFLTTWTNPEINPQDSYILGSTFAVLCGKDREKHFKALLTPKEPYICVAAAVYLCYEDEQAGIAALKKLTALEGDAGAWAALTLARRGDKDAVPRLLEVFRPVKYKTPEEEKAYFGVNTMPHTNLQARVVELFSNAAKGVDVPQSSWPSTRRENDTAAFDQMDEWWKKNGDKVKLHDPWLEILAKKKVD